jgi:hypothetical protein
MKSKTIYVGIVSLSFAMISVMFLGIYFWVSQMNITPQLFDQWNHISASIACITAPIAVGFGIFGMLGNNSSKVVSSFSLFLVGAPFLFLLGQFALSWLP